jgi:hypothetical protein
MFYSCEGDNGVESPPANSAIQGNVIYLDGTAGAYAPVQLRKLSSSLLLYSNADADGNYSFDSLSPGNYIVRFRTSSADINNFEIEVELGQDQIIEQNIYLLYRYLDEFNALKKSRDVFLIKFQPEGGRIGNNYEFVDFLSGTFLGDIENNFTLSSSIYEIPDSIDWMASDTLFSPEYIESNFLFLTSIDETFINGVHEIRFSGDDLIKILSNPINGFAFVKKGDLSQELMIPCIDVINNDFGLIINYKP